MVRTRHLHCCGPGSIPGWRTKMLWPKKIGWLGASSLRHYLNRHLKQEARDMATMEEHYSRQRKWCKDPGEWPWLACSRNSMEASVAGMKRARQITFLQRDNIISYRTLHDCNDLDFQSYWNRIHWRFLQRELWTDLSAKNVILASVLKTGGEGPWQKHSPFRRL